MGVRLLTSASSRGFLLFGAIIRTGQHRRRCCHVTLLRRQGNSTAVVAVSALGNTRGAAGDGFLVRGGCCIAAPCGDLADESSGTQPTFPMPEHSWDDMDERCWDALLQAAGLTKVLVVHLRQKELTHAISSNSTKIWAGNSTIYTQFVYLIYIYIYLQKCIRRMKQCS